MRDLIALNLYKRLLLIVPLNLLLSYTIGFRLLPSIAVVLQVLLAVSSIVFLYYKKPFKKLNPYFLEKSFSLLLWPIKFVLRGIVTLLIFLLLVSPIFEDRLEIRQDKLRIYSPFNGIISLCCEYRLTDARLLIFEQELTNISLQQTLSSAEATITQTDQEILFRYKSHDFDEESKEFEFVHNTLRFIR